MESRFNFTTVKGQGRHNVVGIIKDTRPIRSYVTDVCVIYEGSSPVLTEQVCDALNMAHELSQLPEKDTKADMQSIIKKYRISIS